MFEWNVLCGCAMALGVGIITTMPTFDFKHTNKFAERISLLLAAFVVVVVACAQDEPNGIAHKFSCRKCV